MSGCYHKTALTVSQIWCLALHQVQEKSKFHSLLLFFLFAWLLYFMLYLYCYTAILFVRTVISLNIIFSSCMTYFETEEILVYIVKSSLYKNSLHFMFLWIMWYNFIITYVTEYHHTSYLVELAHKLMLNKNKILCI